MTNWSSRVFDDELQGSEGSLVRYRRTIGASGPRSKSKMRQTEEARRPDSRGTKATTRFASLGDLAGARCDPAKVPSLLCLWQSGINTLCYTTTNLLVVTRRHTLRTP